MKTLSLSILILLLPALLLAGIFPKAGTTAAPFLKIGAGARAVALGGNYVALANDASALYWNPAGISALEGIQISGTHTEWFAGITHDYFAVTAALSDAVNLGFDVIYLNSGDIEQTTLNEQDGNGIFYDATDLAMGFTYARRLTNRFTVAAKGKYISQKIYNEQASSFAVDFGTLYRTAFHGLRIGMNLANFGGSMRMSGSDLVQVQEDPLTGAASDIELKTEGWPLPVIFRVGLAVDLLGEEEAIWNGGQNRVTLAIDGVHPNDNRETIGAGVEYMWNDLLALRAGYRNNHDVEKFSFGGGLHLRLAGRPVQFDYAYASFGDLESVQRFSVALGW